MNKAHTRKMFPGAVTYNGFFSFYNYIIEPDAEHIFVIKGGPGVGKSTLMKKIGESMLEKGYDIEYHCCSSDNNSIDGVVIPKLGIALLDGTAPHIVDPKNPGAVDEIINLGDYWDESVMKKAKNEIIQSNKKVSRFFQSAYFSLKEAKTALDEWKFYVSEYQNWAEIDKMILNLEKELFNNLTPKGHGKERHLFAWSHTPQGKMQYIDSLLNSITKLYVLKGQPGTGKSTFISRIAQRALTYGLYTEVYHNTLDADKLDLVILPEIETAFVISSEPYIYNPDFKGTIENLDFDATLNIEAIKEYEDQINDCKERVNLHIERAITNSSRAKKMHDLMETYYIPAMDFKAIEKKRLSILERIFKMTDDEAIAVTSYQINK